MKLKTVTKEIFSAKPWEYIDTMDLLLVELAPEKVMCFTIGGFSDYMFSIGCFFSFDDYLNFRRLIKENKTKAEYERLALLNRINGIVCMFYGFSYKNAADVPEFEFFECKEGYEERKINEKEIKTMYEAFGHLAMMIKSLQVGKFNAEFKEVGAMVRTYVKESKLWFNFPYKFDLPNNFYGHEIIFNEDESLKFIRELKAKNYTIELEGEYFNTLIEDDEEIKRNYYPYFITIIEGKTSEIYVNSYISPIFNKIDVILTLIVKLCKEHGKPKKIKIRNREIELFLKDYCDKTGIELIVQKELSKSKIDRKGIYESFSVPEKTYIISVSLKKGCYRHIKISSKATLFDLHEEIIDAFEFYDDHAHAFFMDNKAWSSYDAYYADFTENEDQFTSEYEIGDVLEEKQKFKYIFDFGDEWLFQCNVLRVEDKPCEYAEVIRSVGEAPEQYGDFDEEDW